MIKGSEAPRAVRARQGRGVQRCDAQRTCTAVAGAATGCRSGRLVPCAAVKAGMFTLAVLGVLASVVGCYYYLLIVKIMYFDDPAPAFDPMGNALQTIVAVTGLFVILFFVYPGPLVEAAGVAAKSLF